MFYIYQMNGICALIHSTGWAVTNEATFDADKHLIEVEGKKFSKNILTIKLNAIFEVEGRVTEGQPVECIFKSEDGKKHAFVGLIKSRGKQLTVVHELLKSERYAEILKKIKK